MRINTEQKIIVKPDASPKADRRTFLRQAGTAGLALFGLGVSENTAEATGVIKKDGRTKFIPTPNPPSQEERDRAREKSKDILPFVFLALVTPPAVLELLNYRKEELEYKREVLENSSEKI